MIEQALRRRGVGLHLRLTIRSLVSLGIIALAVILPQIAHLAFGAQAGVRFLPMYLPVVLGGCLLGPFFGAVVGLLSPLVSFLITSAVSSPMPALARLPFMMAELAVFALVAGLFSPAVARRSWLAFPAVLTAMLAGRASFLLAVALFGSGTPFTVPMIWGQIVSGIPGLVIQAVVVPLAVMGLSALLRRDDRA